VVAGPPTPAESAAFLSSVNSYLGLLRHYNTYRLRARLLSQRVSPWWLRRFAVASGAAKVIRRGCGPNGSSRRTAMPPGTTADGQEPRRSR
jgi:hypothetical protein